ncbi:hypothetical protein ACJIZ3_001788 [Penstemon smallii]|uniref:FBD domain-containing protein n=1 Tax=Penstemon smallii TaxID=265156 RepID=A0ABD3U4Y4_9LAMI
MYQLNLRKKSLKTSQANREARISNLPEGVIIHILSRLPTKYAWTFSYNIDMDDSKPFRSCKKTKFVNSVERVLFFSQNVKSFRLSCCEKYDLNRITAWISAVLRRNHDGIVLPLRSLVNCTSLKKLELKLPCIFKVPMKNCFPNLTILYLEEVEILNTQSITEPLKITFPVVETCELIRCKLLKVKIVELFAPALTKFKSVPPDEAEVNDYSNNIHGSRLVKFESSSELLETFDMSNSPISYATLLSFRVTSLEKSGLQVRKLLKGFSSLKELELSGAVVKAIAQSKHGVALPRYNSLERLVMSSSGSSEALLEILHASPHLKHLDIDVRYWDRYDYDAVRSVPSCVSSSLEEVKFNFFDFSGKKSEFYLAKFLLKNAILLKKVHLSAISYRTELKNEILEELSTFPKNSVCCLTIVVT